MTSSLVGSEMCIRDSFRAGRMQAKRRHFARRLVRASGEPARCPHDAGAVSYTHLTLPTICSV
eukprot:12352978-Prorocentrum_lima.AAC.1